MESDLFTWTESDSTKEDGFKEKRRFGADVRKEFFTQSVVRH